MRRFGLLGYPLGHSFSPAYFSEKFRHENIKNARYELFEFSELTDFFSFLLENKDIEGFNVTIPYKEKILSFLSEVDEWVMRIAAVNCVKVVDNQSDKPILKGYNTDAQAFEETLLEGWNLPDTALVFGAGGAAKAVAAVLQKHNIDYRFVSRSHQGDFVINYADITDKILKDRKLWINATPVGMFPLINSILPVHCEMLTEEHFVYDLIYNPEETQLLRAAQKFRAQVKNGLPMLHRQADLSWQIWNR